MSYASECRRYITAIGPFVIPIVLACSGHAIAAEEGAAAWKAGKIYVSAALSTSGMACESTLDGKCVKDIKAGRHPVIVVLHGCGGPRNPVPFLNLGAILVAPNSFAGGLRCKRGIKYMRQLLSSRYSDVAYAAKQLKAAPWADPAKLILAGFSNGAQTTATYPGNEFKARIIIAWPCNNPYTPSQNGVRGSGPVLALLGTADEHYRKIRISGNCNAAVAKRPNSRSILIKGGGHEIFTHPTTRKAVAAFVPPLVK
jgi:dienelactone hydrolase